MKTNLIYFHSDAREATATVLAVRPVGEFEDDDRPCIILSDTVMQHKTQDRVADNGWIDGLEVVNVTKSRLGEVQHHIAGGEDRFRNGQKVRVRVDSRRRDCQARLLCGGRLIELVGPRVFPDLQAVAADYRPNRACVQFGAPDYIPAPETVLQGFCKEVERLISLDLPVTATTFTDAPFRRVQFGDLSPTFTCSGAYPPSLKVIGKLTITKIASIAGRLQVRYRVEDKVQ